MVFYCVVYEGGSYKCRHVFCVAKSFSRAIVDTSSSLFESCLLKGVEMLVLFRDIDGM